MNDSIPNNLTDSQKESVVAAEFHSGLSAQTCQELLEAGYILQLETDGPRWMPPASFNRLNPSRYNGVRAISFESIVVTEALILQTERPEGWPNFPTTPDTSE